MIEYILLMLAGFVIIAKAGDIFVDSACRIAYILGVSQAVIALTLVSFATSTPEFVTSTMAAGLGNVGISYGNAVGSCIVNIALVLALAAIFGATRVGRERLIEGVIMLAIGSALVAMALTNNQLWWIEGLLLLLLFGLFLGFVIKREARKRARKSPAQKRGLPRQALLFALGTAGIIIGSWLLIYSGVRIALSVGISEAAIGFTAIAIGTSLPELATIVIAIRKRLPEFSVGTIVGSNIFNIAFVIGIAALISPLAVNLQVHWFSNLMMLLTMGALLLFMKTGLKKREGAVLLALYVVYLVGLGFWH